MCEQTFSYLSSIKSKDSNISQLRMKSVYVYLRFDLKLSISVAKDRHMLHIRDVCLTLSNGSESNIFLVRLLR